MNPGLRSATPGHPPVPSRFFVFVQIAMILACITGVELLIIFLPFPRPLLVGGLVLLSAVKFLVVIFFFMHLRWDKALLTGVFFVGLVLGGGTLWALVSLFGAGASVPLTGAG